jgi:hypothetical protein
MKRPIFPSVRVASTCSFQQNCSLTCSSDLTDLPTPRFRTQTFRVVDQIGPFFYYSSKAKHSAKMIEAEKSKNVGLEGLDSHDHSNASRLAKFVCPADKIL